MTVKKIIQIVLLVISAFLITIYVAIISGILRTPHSTSRVSSDTGGFGATRSNGVDVNNPRILVGWVRNVLAVKVTREIGRAPHVLSPTIQFPHVQYEAQVIYNIKGYASGTIILDLDPVGGELAPGSTYLIVSRPWKEPGWYYMATEPAGRTLISDDASLSNEQLLNMVLNNDRTYELLNAYPNEILYPNDVAHNDIANSFQSLSDQDKQAIFAKFQELIPPRPVPEILSSPPPPPIPPQPPQHFEEGTNYSTCHDNIDEDGNGLKDCADPACAQFCPPQPTPPPPPAPTSTPVSAPTPTPTSTASSTGI